MKRPAFLIIMLVWASIAYAQTETGFTEATINSKGSAHVQGITAVSAFTDSSSSAPLIVKNAYGYINWGQGYAIAYGKGKIINGYNKKICISMARRAALIDAHAVAIEMIEKMNLDGDKSVSDFISKDTRLFYRLKGIIARVKPFEEHANNGVYSVKIRVPFYGIKGIAAIFINAYVKAKPWSGTANNVSKKRLIIDARGIGLKPVMFIKVLDQHDVDLYTAGSVNKTELINNGMVSYDLTTTSQAGDVYIKAIKTSGNSGSNIVIDNPDAAKLEQDRKAVNALSSGNVVIITD
ncbi:MAG: hypothetical protein M1381_10405 [Deltaproteobacteria bacterium]|nr:hypothetical protein [Deltaproteobacteria bacterium]